MKILSSVILALCCLFFIVSCEKEVDEMVEYKIPIDSLYFSCKIDGELITLKSPFNSGTEVVGCRRLFKPNIGTKDSSVVNFLTVKNRNGIRLTFGVSKIFLVDTTTSIFSKDGLNYKNDIYKIGTYAFQYINADMDDHYVSSSIAAQNEGFFIKIEDTNKGITYTSYPRYITDYSKAKYDEFKSLGSFRVTKAMPLNSGIYSDYRNAWFMEAAFNCKLYENNEEATNSISLTDGIISGVF